MTAFSFSSTAEDVTEGLSLAGKTIVVTGVNSGIGQESARVLALRGAYIIGLARRAESANAALAALGVAGAGVACDLSEPASVRAAAAEVAALGRPLDVLLCNAGIMALPERAQQHGFELQFLTNHLGHYLLTTRLLDALAPAGRVVVVSSAAHGMAPKEGILFDDLEAERSYDPWQRYGQSKLANILFARALDRRLRGRGQMAVSLHPGVIRTNLGRHNPAQVDALIAGMDPSRVKSIPQGAATQVLLAARPEVQEAGGQYWADCQPAPTKGPANDDELAERLWAVSEAWAASLD